MILRMPSAVIDRPKITRAMYQSLKRYILREREKKKQGIYSKSIKCANYLLHVYV